MINSTAALVNQYIIDIFFQYQLYIYYTFYFYFLCRSSHKVAYMKNV